MLAVNGSEDFKASVIRALQCLDSRAEFINVNVVHIDTTIQGNAGRVKTRALLEGLISSGYRVTIVHTRSGSECVPTYRNAGRTGSTVRWNTGQSLPHAPACSCIYLGHELCHSHQLILGHIHPSEYYGGRQAKMRYEMLTITGQYGSERAPENAITENDLRREHLPRQPIRASL